VLLLYQNVAEGLVVYPRVIAAHLAAELPFMATENILMAAVAAGGDRQQLHERIRQHSQAAATVVKQEGGRNDLLDRLAADPAFARVDLRTALDPTQFVGRAPQQTDQFLAEVVGPIRKEVRGRPGHGGGSVGVNGRLTPARRGPWRGNAGHRVAGVDHERGVLADQGVVHVAVVRGDQHRVERGQALGRQGHGLHVVLVGPYPGHGGDERVVVLDRRPVMLQQLDQPQRGRLADVVHVLLVGQAQQQDLAPLETLAAVVQGQHQLVDHVLGMAVLTSPASSMNRVGISYSRAFQ